MPGEIFTPPAALAPLNVYPVESGSHSTGVKPNLTGVGPEDPGGVECLPHEIEAYFTGAQPIHLGHVSNNQ